MIPAPGADQPTSKRILVVDDDDDLRLHIARYLTQHGFDVDVARDARSLAATLGRRRPDLIVLDVMLPGEDGLSICRRLSAPDGPAIIMLSAMGEEVDRVTGLEIGADDYLPKPCSPRELLARVRAVLRRRGSEGDGASDRALPGPIASVSFDGFGLDIARRKLYAPNGSVIVLSGNEFAVLMVMLERANEIVSRGELARLAGVGDPLDLDRAVDMQVSRLRRKLHAAANGEIISTVRGQGYRLAAQSVVGLPGPTPAEPSRSANLQ